MENIVVWLADERISRDLLAEIIASLIYEDDYSEELKLKIALAVNQPSFNIQWHSYDLESP